MEITDRVVICLNLVDEAERHGLQVDDRRLARDLGVPVVPTVARYGQGMDQLLQAVHEVAIGEAVSKPYKVRYESPALKHAVSQIVEQLEVALPDLPNPRWVALRLLDGDERITEALRKGELGDLTYGNLEQRAAQLQVIGNQ
jgi:ferrous iron transport protein B